MSEDEKEGFRLVCDVVERCLVALLPKAAKLDAGLMLRQLDDARALVLAPAEEEDAA